MKLLFVTQVIDKNDAVLGAYHGWLAALAPHFEKITVICLREGEHALPAHVVVYSLGKEKKPVSRWRYAWRFLKLAWRQRREYDAVFVHMNQEYILLAGWLWKLWDKNIYFWRNHYAGSLLTDIAAAFCTNVLCTSKFSYAAKYKKTVFMPVGIDTHLFVPSQNVAPLSRSVLFLARMAPSKRPELLIDALALLKKRNVDVVADFYGSPLPRDETYYESLKARAEELGLGSQVTFYPSVPNVETPTIFQSHEIVINTSPSGMFDKTIFEAAACGALPLASSRDWAALVGLQLSFAEGSSTGLAEKIELLLSLSPQEIAALRESLRVVVADNSLDALIRRLSGVLHGTPI